MIQSKVSFLKKTIHIILKRTQSKFNQNQCIFQKQNKKIMKKHNNFALILIFISISIISIEASITCRYCGISLTCPLPFDENKVETITCAKSCLKFDGNSESDNKRVLVRGCGEEDANICNKNSTYHGAKGTTCVCNASHCNGGSDLKANFKLLVPLFVIFSLVQKFCGTNIPLAHY